MGKRKRRNFYGPKIRAEVKQLFVKEGWNYFKIAAKYHFHPAHNTIELWAKKEQSNGLTWLLEKEQYENLVYENLSPQALAEKILQRIHFILQKDVTQFSDKDSDSFSKLMKGMERLVDKKFQIPMLYEMLTKFVDFLKDNYKGLVTEELINAVRHFKNELKSELELGNVTKTL